jgi:hypothetical protein
MTVRYGGGPGARLAPIFRDLVVTKRLYTGGGGSGDDFAVERQDGRWLLGVNTWGEVWLDSSDNGLNLQYSGNTRFRVTSGEVQVPDNGQGNGVNIYNVALSVGRSNRRVGIGRTAWSDVETPLHVQAQNLTAQSRNTAVLLHNHANVDGALVGLAFKVDANGYGSETRVKHALVYERLQSPGIGYLHVLSNTTLNDTNYDPATDVIATWSPPGHYGVQTRTPSVALEVGAAVNVNARAVGVTAAGGGLPAPTGFAAGTESSGGNLRQNGLYEYIIVALIADKLEHGHPSAQIQKQLPNSGGDTWQIPLSWNAVGSATGYRIYFRNANGSGTEFGWQYFEVGAVTSATHTDRLGVAVRWPPLSHGALDARLGATGWAWGNWGVHAKTFGGGDGVLALATVTPPTGQPATGWWLYEDPTTGDLKGISRNGTVRTIALA